LGAVASNAAITGATNTKITYDAKGLVTAGAAATTADIAASTNKNYVTDAQLTKINNTSGTNTGDQTLPTLSSLGAVASNTLITAATNTKITYDAKGLVTAGAAATTADIADSSNRRYVTDDKLVVINNTSGTNTGDQTNISGNAATATTAGNVTGVVAVVNGGTGANNAGNALTNLGAAPISSPNFTGTVSGITKSMIGLGSVDNTSDAGKPVSTAAQTALDLKANIDSPIFTGIPTAPTAASGTGTTQLATTAFVSASNALNIISDGTIKKIVKTTVGGWSTSNKDPNTLYIITS
jgi:hypothetical protein